MAGQFLKIMGYKLTTDLFQIKLVALPRIPFCVSRWDQRQLRKLQFYVITEQIYGLITTPFFIQISELLTMGEIISESSLSVEISSNFKAFNILLNPFVQLPKLVNWWICKFVCLVCKIGFFS